MKRNYIKPKVRIISLQTCNIILGSSKKNYVSYCDKLCNLWHICRDRCEGKPCNDLEL